MNGAPASADSHWSRHATQWDLLGSPLKPGPEDVIAFEDCVRSAAQNLAAPQAIVLGVTQEIVGMAWPIASRVTAFDRLFDMIRERSMGGANHAVCADWCRLPLPEASCDIAIGDKALNALGGARTIVTCLREVHRVLRRNGGLILRIAIRPDEPEDLSAIMADLRRGRIGSFHAFKWRLAMALQDSVDVGVRLADIWDIWRAQVPNPDALLRDLGWNPALVRTIDIYRGVQARYTFPTRSEAMTIFAPLFEQMSYRTGDYELAERCPVVAMVRR